MMYISDCVPGNWELKNPCIEESLKDEPARPVYKIKTDSGSYILKGFSGEMPETTIAGNVRAHLFLGNEKGRMCLTAKCRLDSCALFSTNFVCSHICVDQIEISSRIKRDCP